MELSCGSATLSAAFERAGHDAKAVDHTKNRHKPLVRPVLLDLTVEKDQNTALTMVAAAHIVTMAPPCGTCSRARDRRISQDLQKQGCPDPLPLRSEAQPWGFPELLEDWTP